jgi:carboxypeptidase Taq
MKRNSSLKQDLEILRNTSKELKLIHGILSLLGWDQEVYMPSKGVLGRGKQTAFISELYHNKLISKELGNSIEKLEDNKDKLTRNDKSLLRNISHDYKKAVKIPSEVVKELAEIETISQKAWEKAKKESDFKSFAPYLSKILKLKLEICEKVGYKNSPYDVLLDDFEPYMTEEKLDKLFPKLREETIKILNKIKNNKINIVKKKINLSMPIDKQKQFTLLVLKKLGYDFGAGRRDEVEHPFTTWISANDVRITTHYYKEDFTKALSSSIHEGGHALYEQGRDKKILLTGLDEGISFGIHESQSRTWENFVGRSKYFWKYFLPKLKKLYPKFKSIQEKDLLLEINEVKPSLIRIYADEVTYNLHIIIRFEIEKDLIKGKIKVNDLPEVWNSKMKEYLGIKPKKDSEGVLQDVHWSCGKFGYFPTYSLGNLYAGQFFYKMKKDIPDLNKRIEKGDFACLLNWMREEIHKFGHIYTASEICKKITGKDLDAKYFVNYLNEKYGEMYGF